MEFWIFCAATAGLILLVPWIRVLGKRCVLAVRLSRFCRRHGYTLSAAHPFWMLGRSRSVHCDAYIYGEEGAYAVKLFSIPRHRDVLVFTDDGHYFLRKPRLRAHYGEKPKEQRPRTFPAYDFRFRQPPQILGRSIRPVLLFSPICHEIRKRNFRGEEEIIGSGNRVNGIYVYALSKFLEHLE